MSRRRRLSILSAKPQKFEAYVGFIADDGTAELAIPHPAIDDTIELVTRLHRDQRDKNGVPYIAHPLSVMRMVPEAAWHVAVLHDTLEDCGVTAGRLRAFGYSEDEIAALELVTRNSGEAYDAFIERIATSGNALAIAVKIADLDDNLDPRRGGKIHEKRYREARARLTRARIALAQEGR